MEQLYNFINGEYIPPSLNQYIDVFEPAIGKVYAQVADSNSDDVENAFRFAEDAFSGWSELTVKERADFLNRIADGIESRLDEFAYYESKDTGKPITQARTMDIPRAIANFRFFSEYGSSFDFESNLTDDISKNKVVRSPLGVVSCISPWNLPLYLFSWKIAPALIAGNTVLAKPSELTPYTAFKLGEICQDSGLPPGVLNIIHGQGNIAGDAVVSHPKIKAVSFTGGTATGKLIAEKTASSFKKLSLEMGGKNPAIIFSDCNYDKMLETVIRSSFSNQGQVCLCSSRILIEKSIYDRFKKDFISRVSELIVGDPNDEETQFGAVSSQAHYNKIMVSLVADESEKVVVKQAYQMATDLNAKLVAIHVNEPHAGEMSMMMDSPKEITADIIRDQIKAYGFEGVSEKMDVIIVEGESVSKAIEENCDDVDLLIVGHRKMSQFKSNIMATK